MSALSSSRLLLAVLAGLMAMPAALAQPAPVLEELASVPASLAAWRDRVGTRLTFTLTASPGGTVWGDGTYTDDTSIGAAAIHAGVLTPGQTGIVTIEITGPKERFAGAARNGITSGDYGSWGGSFSFVGDPVLPAADTPLPDPGNLTAYVGQVGQVFTFTVTGVDSGSVWGSGPYTTDTRLARAAVHAGLVQVGETKTLAVEILGPQDSFAPSDANGVSASSWGSYEAAFRFVKVPPPVKKPRPG